MQNVLLAVSMFGEGSTGDMPQVTNVMRRSQPSLMLFVHAVYLAGSSVSAAAGAAAGAAAAGGGA
jgi:hypothetical protein